MELFSRTLMIKNQKFISSLLLLKINLVQKKDRADWVFFNVSFENTIHEAIAIYEGIVIAIGSIPYIFNNYRGFKDYNAQGNAITNVNHTEIKLQAKADGIVVYKTGTSPNKQTIIWEIVGNDCQAVNTNLLDPHWDDH